MVAPGHFEGGRINRPPPPSFHFNQEFGERFLTLLRKRREESNLPTPEGLPPEFREKVKFLVDALVVHGRLYYLEGQETVPVLALRPDADVVCALYLLEQAGIYPCECRLVPPGQSIKDAIHIDTGGRSGFVEEGGSVFFDHHSEKESYTSASQIVYEVLVSAKLLPRNPNLERLVRVVTEIDNLSYEMDRQFFAENWWRTIYGLIQSFPTEIPVDFWLQLLEKYPPTKPIPKEEADAIIIGGKSLSELCTTLRRRVNNSLAGIRKIEEGTGRGRAIQTSIGSTLVNVVEGPTKNEVPLGFTAARAAGYESYVLFNPRSASFFITSKKNLESLYSELKKVFPRVELIRGTMIVLPPGEYSQEINLEEFLNLLSG